jgi:hypothetical protein
VGRAGLAAGRQESFRPRPGRRRERHQPRRRAARAVQRVRPLPDPDRRVGGLCAPAPRPERPARRRLRDAIHLRPGADRIGQAGEELPAGDQPAGVGHLRARHTRRPTTWKSVARAAARRWIACATWSGVSNRRGDRRAPKKASRSCAGACFSRSPTRQFKDRDVVARAFADFYRTQQAEFPPECRESEYEKRIKAAYPIHPEIFDRLYTDWSTLVKFQRTRGVLRLMAAVIHSLWEKGDRNPLILPANIVDRRRARAVRTDPLPLGQLGAGHREGRGRPELAAAEAGQRVAQPGQVLGLPSGGARRSTSARRPLPAAAHRGIEDRRVKLGCVMPGESPAVFGDALRGWPARRPTSTRTGRATGTRPSRR